MKKFLSLMIALVFCLALLPMTAPADAATLEVTGGAGGDAAGRGGTGGFVKDGDDFYAAGGGGGGASDGTNAGNVGTAGSPTEGGSGGLKGTEGGGDNKGGPGGVGDTSSTVDPSEPVTPEVGTAAGGDGGGFEGESFGDYTFTVAGGSGAPNVGTDGGNGGDASLQFSGGTYTTVNVTGGDGGTAAGTGGDATLNATNLTVTSGLTLADGTTAGFGAANLTVDTLTIGGDVTVVVGSGTGTVNIDTVELADGADLLSISGSKFPTTVNLTVTGEAALSSNLSVAEKNLTFIIPDGFDEEDVMLTLGAAITVNMTDSTLKIGVGNAPTLEEDDVITLLKIPDDVTLTGSDLQPRPEPGTKLNDEGPVESDSGHTFDLYYVDDANGGPAEFGYLLAVVTYAPEPRTPGRSSSGGCNAGAFGLFALLAIPLLSMKKKEK